MKIHTDLLFEHHVHAAVALLRHEGAVDLSRGRAQEADRP